MEGINREELIADISKFTLPVSNEIPNVGLFLEQVTKYISEYTAPLESVSITGSMISNYVKKGIIKNPTKKQYGRDQISNLIFIAIAKTVLSLEDIQLILTLAEETGHDVMYERFREELLVRLQEIFSGEPPKKETATTQEGLLLQHTVNTIAYKIYLDKCFASLKK